MKQCKAMTKRGVQCRNRASEGGHGYCKVHYAQRYQSKGKSVDRTTQVTQIVGAAAAIVSIINIFINIFFHFFPAKWVDFWFVRIRELEQYCEHIPEDFKDPTDDARAATVLSTIDREFAQWLDGTVDNGTHLMKYKGPTPREALSEVLQYLGPSEQAAIAKSFAALPPESRKALISLSRYF